MYHGYFDDPTTIEQPKQYEFMTISDIMEELGVGRNRVYEMCATGALPAFRIGKQWRVKRSELLAWKPAE